jgi:hypothetical protein
MWEMDKFRHILHIYTVYDGMLTKWCLFVAYPHGQHQKAAVAELCRPG